MQILLFGSAPDPSFQSRSRRTIPRVSRTPHLVDAEWAKTRPTPVRLRAVAVFVCPLKEGVAKERKREKRKTGTPLLHPPHLYRQIEPLHPHRLQRLQLKPFPANHPPAV